MKNERGFTLIELMIVILIIGILMAYVIPNYQRNVIVSKRTEAHNAILQIASVQERSNAIHHKYASLIGGTSATKDALGLASAPFMSSANYSFSMDNSDGYTISAKAKANTTQIKDTFGADCTTMTLNSLGQKTPLDCWQ